MNRTMPGRFMTQFRCSYFLIAQVVALAIALTTGHPACSAEMKRFYVSPQGADSNAGTPDRPFATIARARDAVRQRNATTTAAADLQDQVVTDGLVGHWGFDETPAILPEVEKLIGKAGLMSPYRDLLELR